MRHLLDILPPHAKVLDLGARSGSFVVDRPDLCVVRLDLEKPSALGTGSYVLGDAARLPFDARSFDLIVSNHSLEHFLGLEDTVREAGRVLKPRGLFYVAVPDATTLTDRIYRWLGRGGGHVNPFRSADEVSSLVERLAGVPLCSSKVLYSSLSFLNAHNFVTPPPRRIALFAFGNERCLAVAIWVLRSLDRYFGTRLSQYGWSFCFGAPHDAPSEPAWINVCVRCGSGHPEAYIRKTARIHRSFLFETYRCPQCGGLNLLSREEKTTQP